jgi:hypothetical protein
MRLMGKLGHSRFQSRPLGPETGQFPPPRANGFGNPERLPKSHHRISVEGPRADLTLGANDVGSYLNNGHTSLTQIECYGMATSALHSKAGTTRRTNLSGLRNKARETKPAR